MAVVPKFTRSLAIVLGVLFVALMLGPTQHMTEASPVHDVVAGLESCPECLVWESRLTTSHHGNSPRLALLDGDTAVLTHYVQLPLAPMVQQVGLDTGRLLYELLPHHHCENHASILSGGVAAICGDFEGDRARELHVFGPDGAHTYGPIPGRAAGIAALQHDVMLLLEPAEDRFVVRTVNTTTFATGPAMMIPTGPDATFFQRPRFQYEPGTGLIALSRGVEDESGQRVREFVVVDLLALLDDPAGDHVLFRTLHDPPGAMDPAYTGTDIVLHPTARVWAFSAWDNEMKRSRVAVVSAASDGPHQNTFLQRHIDNLAFSEDGTRLVVWSSDMAQQYWVSKTTEIHRIDLETGGLDLIDRFLGNHISGLLDGDRIISLSRTATGLVPPPSLMSLRSHDLDTGTETAHWSRMGGSDRIVPQPPVLGGDVMAAMEGGDIVFALAMATNDVADLALDHVVERERGIHAWRIDLNAATPSS